MPVPVMIGTRTQCAQQFLMWPTLLNNLHPFIFLLGEVPHNIPGKTEGSALSMASIWAFRPSWWILLPFAHASCQTPLSHQYFYQLYRITSIPSSVNIQFLIITSCQPARLSKPFVLSMCWPYKHADHLCFARKHFL